MRFLLLLTSVASLASNAFGIVPVAIRCENRENPHGIDVAKPRLSWILDSGQQSAYQIVVDGLWDSGQVASDQSVAVEYDGPDLKSQTRYDWRVRVWDNNGVPGDWSPRGRFVTGILGEPWQGEWIAGEYGASTAKALADGFGGTPRGLPVFKRDIVLDKEIAEAVLSICGLGHYELFLNGRKAGDDLLAPGWSNYRKTCLYDTFDLTDQLRNGRNELRVMLGNGFHNVTGGRYVKLLGSFGQPMLTLQMRVRFNDGTEQTIISDHAWKTASGPITFSCVYGGEDYDARLEDRLDEDAAWTAVTVTDGPGGTMTGLSQAAAPIGAIDTLKAVEVKKISHNLLVHDFGQNVSFMPRLTVKGVAGASVKMIPSELLAKDGRIHDPMCKGNAYYTYTLKGSTTGETWFPRFFYRGGRYLQVELSAPEGKPLPEITTLESVVVHSRAKPAGDFECSNELFNQIRTLIRWAQRSNLMSVITDCPHREKLGWLEQYHLHSDALRYEWDMAAMFVKGMGDMAQAQLDNGLVPDIAPEYKVFDGGFRDSPEWGSSFVIVPWQQYEHTGDTSLLATYFDRMKRYCDYLESRSQDLIVSHGLGDWYDIGPKPPGTSQLTPLEVTATAYFFRCADIISRTAAMLGKSEDAERYGALAARIREVFNRKFWNEEEGVFSTGSQCANAVPLVMGIAEPHMRARALDAIVKDVEAKGLTAGDVGFHYLLRALYEGGRSDVIHAMTNQADKPGYGYQLKKGATALTEAWDAGTRSSHNHFMLGHITEWFYAGLAGINPDPAAPGWKRFIIKPAVVGDLTWVRAHYDSPYGRIISHWRRSGRNLTMDVTVPANSSATIITPDGNQHKAGPGKHVFETVLP
jgi:alpha-L-rhamnosidase